VSAQQVDINTMDKVFCGQVCSMPLLRDLLSSQLQRVLAEGHAEQSLETEGYPEHASINFKICQAAVHVYTRQCRSLYQRGVLGIVECSASSTVKLLDTCASIGRLSLMTYRRRWLRLPVGCRSVYTYTACSRQVWHAYAAWWRGCWCMLCLR